MKGLNCQILNFFQILDDDECLDNTDSCHDDAVCTNTKGAYNCTCNNGYEGDGYNCTGKDLINIRKHCSKREDVCFSLWLS